MGMSIKIQGANFTNFFSSLTLPERTGLVAEYVFGKDAASSIRNRANLALPATVEPSTAGTPVYPTYSPYSVECMAHEAAASAIGINTNILAPADCTVLVIRKLSAIFSKSFAALKSSHVGTVGFTGVGGSNFRNGSAGGTVDVAANVPNPADITSQFFFSAGVGRSTAAAINHTFIDGVRTTTTSANLPALARGTDPFMVGGLTNSSTFRGASSTAYAAVYDRLLTVAEIDAAYAQLKAYYNGKIVIS